MLMDFYWHIMHLWFFVAQFGLPDHLISPMLSRTSSVSFQDFSLTPLKRKYWGDEGGGGRGCEYTVGRDLFSFVHLFYT